VKTIFTHQIQAIEGGVNTHQNVNWNGGLKIDISADSSEDHHRSITIQSLVGDDKVLSRATFSAISGPLWGKFPHWKKYPTEKPPHILSSVNNKRLEILGQVALPFSMNIVNLSHNFLVMEKMTSQMILGLDWLHKHGCNINICQKFITLSVPEPDKETLQALAELPQIIQIEDSERVHMGTSFETKIILPDTQI
jgi:hypothetical protein